MRSARLRARLLKAFPAANHCGAPADQSRRSALTHSEEPRSKFYAVPNMKIAAAHDLCNFGFFAANALGPKKWPIASWTLATIPPLFGAQKFPVWVKIQALDFLAAAKIQQRLFVAAFAFHDEWKLRRWARRASCRPLCARLIECGDLRHWPVFTLLMRKVARTLIEARVAAYIRGNAACSRCNEQHVGHSVPERGHHCHPMQ